MGIKRREFLASASGAAGLAVVPGAMAAKAVKGGVPVYKQASAPVAARVEDLLGRMTLDEKIAQLQCVWLTKKDLQNDDTSFSAEKAKRVHPNGMGMFARPSDRQIGADNNAGNSGAVGNRATSSMTRPSSCQRAPATPSYADRYPNAGIAGSRPSR